MPSIVPSLESILGADAVQPWEKVDAALQAQILQAVTPGSSIAALVSPPSAAELSEVIACAQHNQWRFLLYGNGSKLHWGGLAEGIQLVISTTRLNRLIDHAVGDLTVTAEAGMKLADLQAILAQQNQFLALDPAYAATATLGGIVATADSGFLRQRYGGVRDMLIGISFARSDGKLSKAGGRVVKNVAGYDLMKLMTGSYGTLGAIDQVTFRIYPLPSASRSVLLTGTAEAIAQATSTLLASALAPTAIEVLSPSLVANLAVGQGMGLLARFQSIEVSVEKQASQLLQVGQTLNLTGSEWVHHGEADLWHRLRESMEAVSNAPPITCKIGVLPSHAVEVLDRLTQLAPEAIAWIHAGSGLGLVQCQGTIAPAALLQLRDLCQSWGGFLSVLQAPLSLKQTIDLWGYTGNGLEVMQAIKQQFDPDRLFSPGRFVGGI